MHPRTDTERQERASPPRLRGAHASPHERRTTWSELFFDLVYVVAISRLAHGLKLAPTLEGAMAFVGLFVPVWWSWVGITFHKDRFDADDVPDRLLLAVQMLVVAALAVQLHDGTGANAAGFAMAYGALRLLLILQYARVGWHIPAARPLARRYVVGFSLAVGVWFVSLLVPPPLRFALWAVGIAIDLITPLTARAQQAELPLSPSHLPERFGLFTLIVLGESLVAVVGGVAEQHWAPASVLAAVLSFAFAFAMGWLYFEDVERAIAHRTRHTRQTWVYLHLLLMMGLTATGAGAELVITSLPGAAVAPAARWLFCIATAGCFASLGIMLASTAQAPSPDGRRDVRPGLLLGAAAVMGLVAVRGGYLPGFALTGSAAVLTVLLLIAGRVRREAP